MKTMSEDLYTTMGGESNGIPSPVSPLSPANGPSRRPLSRIMSQDKSTGNNTPGSRLSRSQTMMYHSTVSPVSPVKPRSPTYIGALDHLDRSPRRTHGSFDNSALPSSPGYSRTSSNLQRSMTTKGGGSVYGKNPWEEDEYVNPGGSKPRSNTPTGGPAARRINQQRQFQTVKLPKNPFIDPEATEDYADMTGHMNRASGMAELRNNHQYKSMISRTPHTARQEFQSAFDEAGAETDGIELTRNYSAGGSIKSGARSPMIKRSDTTPVLSFQDSSYTSSLPERQISESKGNGHVGSPKASSTVVDGPNLNTAERTSSKSGISQFPETRNRVDSTKKEALLKSSSLQEKPHLSVSSPAHSTVSAETTLTTVPPSTPASPAVLYKNEKETLGENVAIVIEETGPTSPRYAPEKAVSGLNTVREMKFEDPATDPRNTRGIAIVVVCVIIFVGLAAAVVYLGIKTASQQNEIAALKRQLNSDATTRSEESILETTTELRGDDTTYHPFTSAYTDGDDDTTAVIQQTTEGSSSTSPKIATTKEISNLNTTALRATDAVSTMARVPTATSRPTNTTGSGTVRE